MGRTETPINVRIMQYSRDSIVRSMQCDAVAVCTILEASSIVMVMENCVRMQLTKLRIEHLRHARIIDR